MNYIEMNIETTIEGLEPILAKLVDIGITDTVVDDPRDVADLMNQKDTYQWDYLDDSVVEQLENVPKITIYLEDTIENRNKIQEVKAQLGVLRNEIKQGLFGPNEDFGPLELDVKLEDDSLWKDKWKEYFKPTKISNRIVVKPTWEEYKKKTEDELVLEIDPGMAFGTGTHETTSMCVKMLEKYITSSDRILDVGCGSGILSIGAALLGASDVLGVDIDPIAVQVSQENIELNKVEKTCRAQTGDLTKGIDYKANIVVANLMADLVIMLSPDVAKHLEEGGYYISSGILVEKKDVVSQAIIKAGYKIIEIIQDGEWCCIIAQLEK